MYFWYTICIVGFCNMFIKIRMWLTAHFIGQVFNSAKPETKTLSWYKIFVSVECYAYLL